MRSVPLAFPSKQPLTPSAETDDSHDSRSSGLTRSTTSGAYTRPRAKSGGALLQRANTTALPVRTSPSRFGPNAGYPIGGWNDVGDNSSNSHFGDDDDPDDADCQEWGLEPGMELFEVSAKDDTGAKFTFIGITPSIRG